MTGPMDVKIRLQLARYLVGEAPLAEFEESFLPATWDVTPETDPSAAPLVAEIHLALAEFSNGHLSEAELKQRLIPSVYNLVSAPPALNGSGDDIFASASFLIPESKPADRPHAWECW